MSLAPMSASGVPANVGADSELRAAKMAKNQQKAEGAAAQALIESAGQAGPSKPIGSSGHNINISV
jgi:hypothetical protein